MGGNPSNLNFLFILDFVFIFIPFNSCCLFLVLFYFVLVLIWVDICRRFQRICFQFLFVGRFWPCFGSNLEKWWTYRFKPLVLAFRCRKNQVIWTSTDLVMIKTLSAAPGIRMQKIYFVDSFVYHFNKREFFFSLIFPYLFFILLHWGQCMI